MSADLLLAFLEEGLKQINEPDDKEPTVCHIKAAALGSGQRDMALALSRYKYFNTTET